MITDETILKDVFDRYSTMSISKYLALDITDCDDLREFLEEYYSRGYKMPTNLTPEETKKKIESLYGIFPIGNVENA